MAIRSVVTRGFGNGTFNGTIALVVTMGFALGEIALTIPGLEYTAPNDRMHYTASDDRMHYTALDDRIQYTAPDGRLHFTAPNNKLHYTAEDED